ncbi:MAG: YXWGXW repeat-containing protein [Caldimonas sp.]
MFAKLTTAAILALASATFSTASIAGPVSLDIRVGPPAPRVELVPAPRRGYLWTPGYWDWRGRRHVWVGGNWVRERPGYVYAHPGWVQEGDHWRLNRGAWNRGPGGDRDHDGVPNRFDRRPNDPHRR